MTSYRVASQPIEREWLIYRFWDINNRLLYIGETGRMAVVRWLEHVRDQPWAHEIAKMERQALTYPTEAAALAAEEFAIKTEKPIYNGTHNYGNPNRILSQPHRMSGQRDGRRPAPRTPFRPPGCRSFWTLRRAAIAAGVGAWMLALGGLWWATAVRVGVKDGFIGSVVVMVALSIAAVSKAKPRRRRRYR